MKNKVNKIFKNFKEVIDLPAMKILPGQIAFFFLMSFIPILTILIMIASYLFKNFDFLSEISKIIPSSLLNIITQVLTSPSESYNIIVILLCYTFIASNGTGAIILASDTLYGINPPGYINRKLKSIVMIIILTLLIMFLIFIPLLGDTIVKFLLNFIKAPPKIYEYASLFKFLKTVIAFIIIYFNINLIYTMAPDKKIKSKNHTLGSIFTTISWIISTEVFSFYITKIADYSLIYGNFANILIILLWVYLLAFLFVVGMALNANIFNKSEEG